ncbi:hypothetical protein [uncultured Helicobacter sp.]|uniref:hypothetical protein n=1 Tax=uncultured Helicobacter sp. TaxID=175537 RepID=UPI00260C728B|nr:hypothetical protein [uncultured Helicobacter sp.]
MVFTRTRIIAKSLCTPVAALAVSGLLLGGCFAQKGAPAQEPQVSMQQCAQIDRVEIAASKVNELNITADQITQEISPKLFELCEKLDQVYTAHINYESKLDQAVSTTKLTAKETKTATFAINLELKAEGKTYTFNGKAMLEASGKKVLDIGESVQIEPKDKQMLIKQAVQAAINEAQKAIKADSAKKVAEPAPGQTTEKTTEQVSQEAGK